jgi:hypothetical protein
MTLHAEIAEQLERSARLPNELDHAKKDRP